MEDAVYNAELNRVLKYSTSDAANLLHQMQENPELQRPDAAHRLITADALDEVGREPEARLLRSPHPIYFWRNRVYHQRTLPHQDTEFAHGYRRAALWASYDPDTGHPLDDRFDLHHIDEDTDNELEGDANHFLNSHAHLLPADYLYQAGQDFWLSRNGHGDGFFARPEVYNDDATTLQKEANRAGEYDLTPYPMPENNATDASWRLGGSGGSKDWGQPAGLPEGHQ